MVLRIFDTDPDARPKTQVYDDHAFNLSFGKSLGGGRLTTFTEWRFTTGNREIADAIAELYGGAPREWETAHDDGLEILTNTSSLEIVLAGPQAIRDPMEQWDRNTNQLVHRCDGVSFLENPFRPQDEPGTPCGCPKLLADRKEAAKAGRGPKPAIQIEFRLADDLDLGLGAYKTGSWGMAGELYLSQGNLEHFGESLATLSLEHITSQKTGKSWTAPRLRVKSAWQRAIAA